MKQLALHWLGKLAVWLHYEGHWDIHALKAIHRPHHPMGRRVDVPTGLRWSVWARDNFTCIYCLDKGVPLSLDHIVPQKYGGEATYENLVSACYSCNNRKGADGFDAFVTSEWLIKKRKQNYRLRSLIMSPKRKCKIQSSLERTLNEPGISSLLSIMEQGLIGDQKNGRLQRSFLPSSQEKPSST